MEEFSEESSSCPWRALLGELSMEELLMAELSMEESGGALHAIYGGAPHGRAARYGTRGRGAK